MVIDVSTAVRILRIKIETVSFSVHLLPVFFCDVFETIISNSFSGFDVILTVHLR